METESCKNCKRQVPVENFQMHLMHCKRNIKLCPLCGEAVSQKEEKEHFEEYHTAIDCVQCGQKTTRIEEENHLANECGKRLIPCRYCEISLPKEKMVEHEEFCGSRTELCQQCSSYVLIKDLREHEKYCNEGTLIAVLPCEFCGAPISHNRLDAHQRQCLIEEESLQCDIPLLVEGEDGLFREIEMATATMANHQGETGSGSSNVTHSVSHESVTALNAQENSDNSVVALPCEICGELCPSDRLMEHQEECSKTNESDLEREPTSGRQEHEGSTFRFDAFIADRSPHNVFENLIQQSLFSDLEGRMWPFVMTRNIWPRT